MPGVDLEGLVHAYTWSSKSKETLMSLAKAIQDATAKACVGECQINAATKVAGDAIKKRFGLP